MMIFILTHRIQKRRIVFTVLISFFICFTQCTVFKNPAQTSQPVQVITKQFPGGSLYFIMYNIPDTFPPDIPLYSGGQVQKVFIYHERDMDLIVRTTDTIEEIVEFFMHESQKRDWEIERITTDPKASHQTITLPLSYKNQPVETFQYFAYRGHIFAARSGNRVMVCRIIQVADSPYTFIVQQIRTKS